MRLAAIGAVGLGLALSVVVLISLGAGASDGGPRAPGIPADKRKFVNAAEKICATAERRAAELKASDLDLVAMMEQAVADSREELEQLRGLSVPRGDELALGQLFRTLRSLIAQTQDALNAARVQDTDRMKNALSRVLEAGHDAGDLAYDYGLVECANAN